MDTLTTKIVDYYDHILDSKSTALEIKTTDALRDKGIRAEVSVTTEGLQGTIKNSLSLGKISYIAEISNGKHIIMTAKPVLRDYQVTKMYSSIEAQTCRKALPLSVIIDGLSTLLRQRGTSIVLKITSNTREETPSHQTEEVFVSVDAKNGEVSKEVSLAVRILPDGLAEIEILRSSSNRHGFTKRSKAISDANTKQCAAVIISTIHYILLEV